MTRYRMLLGSLVLSLCVSFGGARAQVITEFSAGITAGAFPFGIAAGPDGNVWFTELNGHRIGRITPAGVVTQFSAGITGSPRFITKGPDGNLWFTMGNRSIGRITPAGAVTEFTVGLSLNSETYGITAGPDGNLWFTERQGNRIGRITTAGVVTEFSSGISAGAQPSGIVAGPDGNLWFTEESARRIGKITPLGVVTEYPPLASGGNAVGITVGSDGNLWFMEQAGSQIGRITPAGVVTEFNVGITGTGLVSIAAGPDGNLWFVEGNSNRIGRITTGGVIAEISAGMTAGAGPFSIVTGPDGKLWFTESSGNRIGRISPNILAVIAGTPQYTDANAVFATPWTVKLTDSAGTPLANETVTFVAYPGATSGASAAFIGGGVTDPSGITSVTATANGFGGVYTVLAMHAGSVAAATFNLTNVINSATALNGVTISLTGPPSVTLAELTAVTPPLPTPVGSSFPYGLNGFVIEGLQPGASVGVTATFAPVAGLTYYKYQNGAYFAVPGTIITSTTAKFILTDGGQGDSDGIADGRIVDPGGIAIVGTTPPASTGATSRKAHGSAGTNDLPL